MSLFHLKTEAHRDEPECFQPDHWLTGIILRSQAPFKVVHEVHGILHVDPQRQRFHGARSSLPELCSTPGTALTIRPLREWPATGQSLPLEELLWTSAWYACDGLLPPGHNRHDVIGLRHWPNLTRVPASPDILRLCALLSRKAHSLHLARKLLSIDEPLACRFYSAAWCAGMLDCISHQHELPMQPTSTSDPVCAHPGLGQTLQQLWHRLSGV